VHLTNYSLFRNKEWALARPLVYRAIARIWGFTHCVPTFRAFDILTLSAEPLPLRFIAPFYG